MWDDPPWPDYPHITVPVLLIPAVAAAAADAETPTTGEPAPVDRAAAQLASAVIRPYPGGDHDLHAQHPEQLAADLLSLAARS
jgi:pimeloyl-ACP methyl ester carboxylesterase